MDTTGIQQVRDLGASFQRLFRITAALDAASKDEVFRIRHEVYCRDLGWEAERPDGRESDEFDEHSLHCLLRRRETNEPVGCVRLILASPGKPDHPLPVEVSCRDALDRSIVDPSALPRDSIGEVSRLSVMKAYRQRKGETNLAAPVGEGDFGGSDRFSRFPFIPVSLFLGAAALARRVGVEHVFVLSEPRLASHFARIGFDIRVIGTPIEHRGYRVPSVLSSSRVVSGLRPMIRPLYEVVDSAIDEAFQRNSAACAGTHRP